MIDSSITIDVSYWVGFGCDCYGQIDHRCRRQSVPVDWNCLLQCEQYLLRLVEIVVAVDVLVFDLSVVLLALTLAAP